MRNKKMNEYEKLMNKSAEYKKKCKKYLNKDVNLVMFYNNISIGYEEKARELKLLEMTK